MSSDAGASAGSEETPPSTQERYSRRRCLLAGVNRRVLELGAGNGFNFAHYPSTVSEVIATEREPSLRAAAGQRRSATARP
jgi:protein-L-isoaspartate O-methyltransferase